MVSELDFLSEENIIRWSQALYGLICTIIDFKSPKMMNSLI
jgi:hypothetical protein